MLLGDRHESMWRGENGDRRLPPLSGILLGLGFTFLALALWYVLALAWALASMGL